MINLLFAQKKKALQREYIVRAITTALGALLIAALVGIALLIPSYVLTQSRSRLFLNRAEEVRNNPAFAVTTELNESLREAEMVIGLLDDSDSSSAVLESVLDPVLKHADADDLHVHLTSLQFNHGAEGNQPTLVINGTAETRPELLSFIDVLRSEERFTEVMSPVSNFTQNQDIAFRLELDVNPEYLYE